MKILNILKQYLRVYWVLIVRGAINTQYTIVNTGQCKMVNVKGTLPSQNLFLFLNGDSYSQTVFDVFPYVCWRTRSRPGIRFFFNHGEFFISDEHQSLNLKTFFLLLRFFFFCTCSLKHRFPGSFGKLLEFSFVWYPHVYIESQRPMRRKRLNEEHICVEMLN